MRRVALLMALAAQPALADGFASPDLTEATVPDDLIAGHALQTRAEPERLTIMCVDCGDEFVAIDVLRGRNADGTEGRVRSGETTIADMEALCQAREPLCRIEAAPAGAAVGWVSSYPSPMGAGSTAALLRDGDMLTIRSIAPDAEVARRPASAELERVVPAVIGR